MPDYEAAIERLREMHHPDPAWLDTCWGCDDPWPCDTAILLDRLQAQTPAMSSRRPDALIVVPAGWTSDDNVVLSYADGHNEVCRLIPYQKEGITSEEDSA